LLDLPAGASIIDIIGAMATDKKIFAVIAADAPDALKAKIEATFPDTNLMVGKGQWFIIGLSSMTTQELGVKLEISVDKSISGAIVLSVSSYFGRAPLNIWEWLTAKMGDASGVAG
jgi:hypothetical protein